MAAPAPILDEAAVAEWLGVSPKTLRNWRTAGGGPAFTKVGGAVRYQQDRVQAWLDGRTFDRTPVPGRLRVAS